jgi:large subunit ribosomal protein L28
MSLVKNLKNLTSLRPRPVITWDKSERIRRNKEIWDNKESIVHRLPLHYQHRHWKNVLADIQPVHYRPPEGRYLWDTQKLVEVETEHYPIVPIKTPESDQGLWGGEGVVKGYIESKPFTRKKILPRLWLPKLWFPKLKNVILYSEILDTHMKITVTERALRLIDDAYGLDNYLLNTPEIDINSKLGLQLKRQILISLAKETYAADDPEQHSYIKEKYRRFVVPLEEAEWVGLDLNEACRKQQDLEDNTRPEPLKYKFEKELMEQLEAGDAPLEEDTFKPQKSLFGEKLLGSVMNPLAKRMKVF